MSHLDADGTTATDTPMARTREAGASARGSRASIESSTTTLRGATARLGGHTIKRYTLADGATNTVAQLRGILNQKSLPNDAAVTVAEHALTIEWDE